MTISRADTTRPAAHLPEAHSSALRYTLLMRPVDLADHLFGRDRASLRAIGAQDVAGRALEQIDDEAREALAQTDVLIMGWGAPRLTDDDLASAPHLRAILYAGGQVSGLVPTSAHRRGILLSNAGHANAIPVAEFTTALIVLANKQALRSARLYHERRSMIHREVDFPHAGNRSKSVGIVGASRIGRMVIERLSRLDVDIALYDPFVGQAEAHALGVRPVGLDVLMATSDVVSVHAPLNHDTVGLITRAHLRAMRDGATFINTARGGLVDQEALVDELRTGRIDAMLDVTTPEVLPPAHELYDLPNVLLTPHMAGSTGPELARLGDHVAAEFERLARGLPLLFPEKTR